ncbi:LysR family transcriptional regulator [Pollutimonas bauzanensis]|uniref:DNA-binding transcriptional regulator, LysR family n=1 Tax=Pollutimonas bauzanensis TaxID=658167 RepID=A0A1M5X4G6_9BURK|nr:LysR family transcriptional regulator [Pollutimonas bauzanensis]SHH94414.1 DNA-binding transcriptional regulator, LysR family [Pollutimonas bauzanensis]
MRVQLYLSNLEIFEVAARLASFKLAAQELCLSPSAVSQAIRKLEKDLDQELFLRNGKTLALTGQGAALLASVAIGFKHIREGVADIRKSKERAITLYCPPTFSMKIVGPLLQRFLSKHLDIDIRVTAAHTPNSEFYKEFDIAVLYGSDYAARSDVRPLGVDVLTPLCSAEVARGVHCLRDVFKTPLIVNDTQEAQWGDWLAVNAATNFQGNEVHFNRGYEAIAAAVDGLGFVLESQRIVRHDLEKGILVAPLQTNTKSLTTSLYSIFVGPRSKDRPEVKEFVEAICNSFQTD